MKFNPIMIVLVILIMIVSISLVANSLNNKTLKALSNNTLKL